MSCVGTLPAQIDLYKLTGINQNTSIFELNALELPIARYNSLNLYRYHSKTFHNESFSCAHS